MIMLIPDKKKKEISYKKADVDPSSIEHKQSQE